jgi:IS30 family transposase
MSLVACIQINKPVSQLYSSENENKLHMVRCYMPKDKLLKELNYLEGRELQDITAHMNTSERSILNNSQMGHLFSDCNQLRAKLIV